MLTTFDPYVLHWLQQGEAGRPEDENLLSRQIPTTAEVLEQEETGSRK